MKLSWTNVGVGVVLLIAGFYVGHQPAETVVITRVDTIPYAAFRDSLKAQRLESSGLMAKLAGRSALIPQQIIRTDTLVQAPDTVLQLVALDGRGSLTLAPLIHRDSLWAPELHRFDVGNCDDGFSWNAGTVVCDKARLGHLSIYAEASAEADPFGTINPTADVHAGISWTPSYRSGWLASLAMDRTGHATLAIRRAWRAF